MSESTLVIMVSVGDRARLTKFSFPPLAEWADRHGYSVVLQKNAHNPLKRPPHFNKLLAHKVFPGFDRYIIVDDDLIVKVDAPHMEAIPEGKIGLCKDAVQTNTKAKHVKWTANTGFMVVGKAALKYLEQAYEEGEYPHAWDSDSDLGIWGPFDQGILNHILFSNDSIHEISWRWNFQPVLNYFMEGKGWEKWRTDKLYRLNFYWNLISPFKSKSKDLFRRAYGIHMINGSYPKFYTKVLAWQKRS